MSVNSVGSIMDVLATSGRPVPMPDANAPIKSVLLHRDKSRARTLAVQFPAGFSRPGTGRYEAGEELLVLAGELSLAGLRLEAGDWAWLPPRLPRGNLSSKRGAIVYAWSSAGNDWQACDDSYSGPPARMVPVGLVHPEPRELRGAWAGDGPGSSAIVAAGQRVGGPAELLDLVTLAWTRIETDELHQIGPGPALLRWHQRPARHLANADAAHRARGAG
jgi:hypothetical protein